MELMDVFIISVKSNHTSRSLRFVSLCLMISNTTTLTGDVYWTLNAFLVSLCSCSATEVLL